MKKGEVALVTIPPEYAFGSTESKQDIAVVPPNSTVIYEVELVSFVKVRTWLWYSCASVGINYMFAKFGDFILLPRIRSHGTWTTKRRLRLLARRKKKGMHCSSWANLLELQSVMRRCIILHSVSYWKYHKVATCEISMVCFAWLTDWGICAIVRLQSTSSMTVHSVKRRRSNPSNWRSAATWTMLRANWSWRTTSKLRSFAPRYISSRPAFAN